ncbi:MAG TPA: glutamate synthase central domain-containing protein, partial [Bacillota bacterium]|nr:glutamate synthase central domain-containing protein [Bacillota bacterium]
MKVYGLPHKQGLYDPIHERDACGIGFVANIKGKKSNEIVRQALTILLKLDHRGGQGSEPNTGDGAGILMQIPHSFLARECAKTGLTLPEAGNYGVGMLFLSPDKQKRQQAEELLEQIIREEGQQLLGWREVPTDNSTLGSIAKAAQPAMRQVFIAPDPALTDELAFERKLYVIRKRAEKAIRKNKVDEFFYCASLSTRTIVYKGMLVPDLLDKFFVDLRDPGLESALALVHSRFSTNTFPSWERAHPYRYLIHNGEINTIRGNVNWMHARQSLIRSPLFGEDMAKILPLIDEEGSDSAMFDNALEFLMLAGRSLPHAAMMMIPEPWQNHESMDEDRKAFYEYHSCLMEPWDGPAAIGFTDGKIIGASLDRNGLRPSRYYVTTDDMIVLASEVGVLDIPPEKVLIKERLRPGRMLLVDTEKGRIVSDEELKNSIAREYPYKQWTQEQMVNLQDLPKRPVAATPDANTILKKQQVFGYTYEELKNVLQPMALNAIEPSGSMGNDSPIAVLSDRPQLLYNYFKQLFAQVTNPPIDAIREELVTSTASNVGAEHSLIDTVPEACRQIRVKTPIISNEELSKLRHINKPGFKTVTLSTLFKASEGTGGLEKGMDNLFRNADLAIEAGFSLIILSDRGVDANNAPIPALLALAGLHHHLVRNETRTRVSLILESGEPREVHHFATLLGYGASVINPYLAFES